MNLKIVQGFVDPELFRLNFYYTTIVNSVSTILECIKII